MIAYKFVRSDHTGALTRFRWQLPDGAPGAWAEAPVVPCRAGSMPAAWRISRSGSAASSSSPVIVSVYSSGAIGRLVPENVIGLIKYVREHEAEEQAA